MVLGIQNKKKCNTDMAMLGCCLKAVGQFLIDDNCGKPDLTKKHPANLLEWIK